MKIDLDEPKREGHSGPMSELTPSQYDQMWSQLGDFIRYNPGARHRRRLVWNVLNELQFETFADIGCGRGEFIRMLSH